MITLNIYGKRYEMPEQWNELTGKQLIAISKTVSLNLDELVGKLNLFRTLATFPLGFYMHLYYMPKWLANNLFFKKAEVLLFIHNNLWRTDFLFAANTLTKQLLPEIKGFYGPSSSFENLRMDEFCFSEFFYINYRNTGSKEDLVNLVATLYRPSIRRYDHKRNMKGDCRISFNEHVTKYNAKQLSRVSIHLLKAVLFWYEGCRQQLIDTYPKVFDGKKSDGESFGLFSLITSVAEDGVMGDFDKVNSNYVHVILLRLTELLIKAEKLEEELKTAKANEQ